LHLPSSPHKHSDLSLGGQTIATSYSKCYPPADLHVNNKRETGTGILPSLSAEPAGRTGIRVGGGGGFLPEATAARRLAMLGGVGRGTGAVERVLLFWGANRLIDRARRRVAGGRSEGLMLLPKQGFK